MAEELQHFEIQRFFLYTLYNTTENGLAILLYFSRRTEHSHLFY